jgi:hypothetical protein
MLRTPERFRTLWGAGRAAAASGVTEKAKAFYAQLTDMSGSGSSRPDLVIARAWLEEH